MHLRFFAIKFLIAIKKINRDQCIPH